MLKHIIPSSGEELPVIGMGTWKTFDVEDTATFPALTEVLGKMNAAGASLIDSSPMYGRSEEVIGDITSGMETAGHFFYATKVWTTGLKEGILQMEASMQKMKRSKMDLIQIHNFTDWQTHFPTLQQWKESGKIRYTGITHYLDSSHEDLEKILRKAKFDFVQFNYSIDSRHAEQRLLDVAADLGVATLINRPLGKGCLFDKVKGKALPAWAKEYNIHNWSSYFLKYLISHKAVTCVIPATSNPAHMDDNLQAGFGELPDEAARKKMVDYLDKL